MPALGGRCRLGLPVVLARVEKLTCSPVELLVIRAVKLPMFVEYRASTEVNPPGFGGIFHVLATGSLHLQAGSINCQCTCQSSRPTVSV